METYEKKQFELFENIEKEFKRGNSPATIIDSISDYVHDPRICLTSVVFVPKKIRDKIISDIIKPLESTDRHQYFYLPASLHLTIKNIKTIHFPPTFTLRDVEKVKTIFNQIIPKHKSINFKIQGLLELPTSLNLRVFCNESLRHLVIELDKALIQNNIPDDKKYASNEIFFGSITICRYRQPPNTVFFNKSKRIKKPSYRKARSKNNILNYN